MIDSHSREILSRLHTETLVVLFLIGLNVAARLIPHTPNFMPVTASALFAGMIVSRHWLALTVPITTMLVSDFMVGFDDWRITAFDYVALTLPVIIGLFGRGYRWSRVLVPAAIASSVLFFTVSNFAVWVFGSIYSHDIPGLVKCYVMAFPFLQYTVAGDLVWVAILFGGASLVQRFASHNRAAMA